MPNPVLSWPFALGALLLAAGCDYAQAAPGPAQISPPPQPWSSLSLVAEGSGGHRLEIATEPGVFNHATATLTFRGQTWRATDTECVNFRAALDVFQRLPPLRPGPMLLQPGASRDMPLTPYRRGAEDWVIRTQLYAPDWSSMDVEIRTRPQGPYALWISDTVEVIKRCGPPVGEVS